MSEVWKDDTSYSRILQVATQSTKPNQLHVYIYYVLPKYKRIQGYAGKGGLFSRFFTESELHSGH